MDLAYQSQRKREPAAEALYPMVKRGHVVRHLAHVVERDAGYLVALEEEEIGKPRLRPFDL